MGAIQLSIPGPDRPRRSQSADSYDSFELVTQSSFIYRRLCNLSGWWSRDRQHDRETPFPGSSETLRRYTCARASNGLGRLLSSGNTLYRVLFPMRATLPRAIRRETVGAFRPVNHEGGRVAAMKQLRHAMLVFRGGESGCLGLASVRPVAGGAASGGSGPPVARLATAGDQPHHAICASRANPSFWL